MGETSWLCGCSSSGEGAGASEEGGIRQLKFSPVACFSWLASEGPPGEHPLMTITSSPSLATDWLRDACSARGESLGCIFRTKALVLQNVHALGCDSDYFWRVRRWLCAGNQVFFPCILSQTHRLVGVGRHLRRSSNPTLLPKQVHPERLHRLCPGEF